MFLKGQRSKIRALFLSAVAPSVLVEPANAQLAAEAGDADLEVISVKGQTIPQSNTSFSTTVLSTDDIQFKRVFEVNELLEDVPGVSVRDYGLGGVASQTIIRGFGNGAHGGDLGVVIDGIPLNEANSHADGYVDLNVIVPLEISNLIVYRGPVSALYGNFNRGGLLAFETRKSGNYAQVDTLVGSFEQFDIQGAAGIEVGERQAYNVAAQYYRTDGFRAQSEAERATISLRGSWQITDKFDASLSVRGHTADTNSAAYITLDQFAVDPYGVDPRTKNDGVDKDFGIIRLDLGYQLGDTSKILAYAYTTQQDFTRWFSRGGATAPTWRQREETYDRSVFGGGASLNGRLSVGERQIAYAVGIETFNESTDFQFFEDVDFRQRRFPAEFDRESTLKNLAFFAEADADIIEGLNLSVGIRVERFDGDCTPLGPETGTEPCGTFESVTNAAPKVGLRWQVFEPLQLRFSYSEGFALAEGFAKFATGAQNLNVNGLKQLEIGALLTPMENFQLDVSLYRISSTNEITQLTPGEFVNFGKTIRRGFEASLTWQPNDIFNLRAVYSYAESDIDENPNAALVGNAVTGVPDHTATVMADLFPIKPLRLTGTLRYVGEYFYNSANTLVSEDYTLVDFDAFYTLPTQLDAQLFFSVDNVADNTYATTFFSIGVSPGAPRTFLGGVQIGF